LDPRPQKSGSSSALTLLAGAGLAAAALGACFTGSDGLVPPTKKLYFPTAMVVSPGRTSLYVVNSDFDLQYNGGTVQVIALADEGGRIGLRRLVSAVTDSIAGQADAAAVCSTVASRPNTDAVLYPGPCAPIDYEQFVRAFATVGAFTSGVSYVARQDTPGARLFVTVRGDPSVTFFEVVDDRDPASLSSPCGGPYCLDCNAEGEEKRCASAHRVGDSPVTSVRGLRMPTEPTGIDAAALLPGDALVVAHQTEQAASLVVNRWPEEGAAWPTLEFTLRDLPDGPTGVVHIPPPRIVSVAGATVGYRPGFIVSHRAANALSVLRYEDDAASRPPRPFIVHAEQVSITLNANGSDSRGMAVDDTARRAAEALCADDFDCLLAALDVPMGFYVANRAPASLLVGTIQAEAAVSGGVVTSVNERISLDEAIPVPLGASGVAMGNVIGPTGELEPRVFVVSFDARFVTVYDPSLRRIEAEIRTGRGPFGLAFDTGVDEAGVLRSHLYVSHFTDSYIGVVDLDTRRTTYGAMVVSVGPPVPPREEQ
jgi:hypothetical protein